MENKFAKIPVASHGLHKHSYNYPWLSSINFGDVMPCYYNPVRKGERDSPKAGVFSQLMPIAHNAFVTGRYNFKAIFVPFKQVWRPWYNFDQQTEFMSNGTNFVPRRYPYVTNRVLSSTLLNPDFGLFEQLTGTPPHFDILYLDSGNVAKYYTATVAGCRVLRILGALGSMPSFDYSDETPLNLLPILCYFKAFADYYFPNNYVNSTWYRVLSQFFERDNISYDNLVDGIVLGLNTASLNFYESSVFDLAWDNPLGPNVAGSNPNISVSDVTNDGSARLVVSNARSDSNVTSPSTTAVRPDNGTPYVGGTGSGQVSAGGVFTKYVIDALTAVSLWTKRHQIAGARLIDRFLVSRGVSLPNDSARNSYFLGQRNIEIEVSGVENNTDTNLGELAGRGIASSGNEPLSFECRPDDDGIFFVIVSAVPDANFPVLLDGYCIRQDYMDNYNPQFDKLGVAAVPQKLVQISMSGVVNQSMNGQVFGFLNRYWDEVQERPRLLGDFILGSRGAEELKAYHSFRILSPTLSRAHSYDFIRMEDNSQYQRFFYSEKQENLMLFLRWYGEQYKEKLPLGDSYDWDDDEFNRKVSVVVGGSQK